MREDLQERHGFTVRYLADLVGGTVVGDDSLVITGINRIEQARDGELTFLSNPKYVKFLPLTRASCVIVERSLADSEGANGQTLIVADAAYRGFVLVMQRFFPPLRMDRGLRHAAAVIHPSATVHETAAIGPGCVISEGCDIGEGSQLFANVVLYPGTRVSANTVIHANVTCGPGTQIGARCIVHPGAVIGADGFGFLENPDGSYEKVPHVGIVEIGDDVEIGSNTTIDRAAVGKTLIGNGVKLDNLVHIAHGVTIGANTAMAAQTGISGSAKIGLRNRFGGQVGMIGHIETADDVIIEAQSGVSKPLTAGAYLGSPAKEHRTALRMEAALRQLPRLLQEVRDLQRQVEESNDTAS
ncbi:MAG: UDP-3-O-(3-hydroxymyristoyl)glucosamine N-acyltransferase [bacterium]|nr:UDP-3-O-(3-hydroxymyristoyl)glucosamine N-acyltransferase [bacterium]